MKRDAEIIKRNRPAPLRGYDAKERSDLTSIETGSETRVQQQFAEEVDINTIVRRYGVSPARPLGYGGEGLYGDFTEITDYESAVARVEKVREGFMKLPPEVRERFDNDPGKLIRHAQDLREEDLAFEPIVADPARAPVPPVVPPEH